MFGGREDVRKVLPEIRVKLERCEPGEKAVSLEDPDSLGLRTKLGGEPDRIQPGSETPTCRLCGNPMTFVAQIDSVEHWSEHNPLAKCPFEQHQDYMFGDVGMIYVWFCFGCLETTST
jgi:uncharacterized protein YwqG